MNYAAEWDAAHQKRLMIADQPDSRLVRIIKEITKGAELVEPRPTALDVGCGCAINSEWLAQRGFSVCGFDSSPHAINRAYARLVCKRGPMPRLIIADMTTPWPYRGHAFGAVVDIRSLENLSPDELLFAWKQAGRVLMRGGLFFSIHASPERDDALTTAGKVNKLTESDISALCQAARFNASILKQKTVYGNGKIVHDWQITANKK